MVACTCCRHNSGGSTPQANASSAGEHPLAALLFLLLLLSAQNALASVQRCFLIFR
jgi:hypothetical protein